MKGVALGGFMGAGKTTVGRLLSERVGLAFHDTDEELARRFGSVADQIRDEGLEVWRARERALVKELSESAPCVLATGGGLWVDPANRAAMRQVAWLVVLEAPLDVLRARVAAQGGATGRPLWERAEALLEERRDAYGDADLVVASSGRTAEELADALASWWRSR